MPAPTTYLLDTNVISRVMKDGQGQDCRRHISVKWNSYQFYRSKPVFHLTTPNCEPIWSKPVHPSARMARFHRVPGLHVDNWLQAIP